MCSLVRYVWDCFGEQVEPLAAEVPFMVGVGNHDMFYNGSAFATRFHMPWEASQGEKGNFWCVQRLYVPCRAFLVVFVISFLLPLTTK